MTTSSFAQLYNKALKLQKEGKFNEFPALIDQAIRAGLTEVDIMTLGSLAEGALQFPNRNANP